MYPQLPLRANLEHLKKEAKAVLRVFGRHTNEWRLADAQRAVARGYGFPSWSRLKTHVESVAPVHRPAPRRLRSESRASAMNERSQPSHPIEGTWASREAMLSVEMAGDVVTMTYIAMRQPGDESAAKMSIRVDGDERPLEPGGAELLRARWIDPRTLEITVTKGSEAVGRGHYGVSEAGDTLTVSSADSTVVFQRGQ